MSTPSDTPRTNAIFINCGGDPGQIAKKHYVQNIERELNAALDRVAELEDMNEGLKRIIHAIEKPAQPPARQYLDRPDKPGWWWRLRQGGRNGAEWHIGQVKLIDWLDDDYRDEPVLCWSSGGNWTVCADMHGDQFYPATTPPPPSKEGQP